MKLKTWDMNTGSRKVRGRLFPEERTACAMVWVRESAGVGYGDRYDCEQDREWNVGPNGEGLC